MRLADAVRPRGNFISDGSGVCGTGIPFASCMQTAVMTMIWYCVLQRGKSWVICSDVWSQTMTETFFRTLKHKLAVSFLAVRFVSAINRVYLIWVFLKELINALKVLPSLWIAAQNTLL